MFKNLFGKKNKNKDKMSFKAGFDLTGLPVVTFYQGNKKLNFVLDTGSNECVINKAALKGLKYTVDQHQKFSITGLDGIEQVVDYADITLSFNDKDFSYGFQIIDMGNALKILKRNTGVTVHGLIGSSFFNKFKYILDFDELTAYSKL